MWSSEGRVARAEGQQVQRHGRAWYIQRTSGGQSGCRAVREGNRGRRMEIRIPVAITSSIGPCWWTFKVFRSSATMTTFVHISLSTSASLSGGKLLGVGLLGQRKVHFRF